MNQRLAGKVALVTGGGTGIGASSARMLASHGARIAVADVRLEAAQVVANLIQEAGGIAVASEIDVADEASWAEAMPKICSALGPPTVLHSNAAAMSLLSRDLEVAEMETAVWDQVMAVNVRGSMLACRSVLPGMVLAGEGSVIFTSSIAANFANTVRSAYATSKGAIDAFMRSVATGYGRYGIRANCVAPGIVETAAASAANSELTRSALAGAASLGRSAHPDEITNVVAFLASSEASFITGEVIVVDGGLTSHMPVLTITGSI